MNAVSALKTEVTIEVFGTNVGSAREAGYVKDVLYRCFPQSRITFDLQDCDKVLRLEGIDLAPAKIQSLVESLGFYCQPLH